jgi:hypothetical protein
MQSAFISYPTETADRLERDQLRRMARYLRLSSDIAEATRRADAGWRLETQLRRLRPV